MPVIGRFRRTNILQDFDVNLFPTFFINLSLAAQPKV